MREQKSGSDLVACWLALILVLLVTMISVGGITRLTGSGLSITEWKPILGAIPPLQENEWLEVFEKYKKIPQFEMLHSSMDLSQFKFIYYWEYAHRLLGRLIAVVVLVPGLLFTVRKSLGQKFSLRVLIGFALGAIQGSLGWFMVKSGLSESIYVSHIRLAAHLLLGMSILSYWCVLYLAWKSRFEERNCAGSVFNQFKFSIFAIGGLLFFQLMYGAFMAGLGAGNGYNTFPKMNGDWIPFPLTQLALIQFIHRWLAVLLLIVTVVVVARMKEMEVPYRSRKSGVYFLVLLCAQFFLGVLTLVFNVPLVLASLHQLNACFLVICITAWSYRSGVGGASHEI